MDEYNLSKKLKSTFECAFDLYNPGETLKKITDDIVNKRDKEMALEFTKKIAELLKMNGVEPQIEEHTQENFCDNSIEYRYGFAITGLDFTEHDKRIKDEISDLRKELSESKNHITLLKHELEEKCSFETDRLVELPFNPLETVNVLINATYKAENTFLERQINRNVYDIDDLEQIAEHLIVYCKHNREE